MKQIEATILGQSYVLACPPGGEALLLEAINIVDREMSAIRDAGKVKARERMAVLAALNLAYQRAEQTRVPAPAAPVRSNGHNGSDAAAVAGSTDIDALIHRIDLALGDDGLLL
ncbi:cell division protein ZapA [Aquincola sp. S2]|uniref:Cell division protein ZapA n=1 Tax=Pseudaquabacterium terrae TaxID=2732868 RepID=A0ABX2EP85_9BURK|nr:cell division protein ZapA [Aquabacterium terrae]NRF70460.1 cell division protein ZapA [Aquabacterium terrae]